MVNIRFKFLKKILFLFLMMMTGNSWGNNKKYLANCSSVFAISGGANPSANHLRYYDNLARVQDIFQNCPIENFVASGNEDDLVTMDYISVDTINQSGKKQKAKKINLDSEGMPVLKAQKVAGGQSGGANVEDIARGVRNFVGKEKWEDQKKSVLVYVTDHGSFVGNQGVVSLWNKEHLSAEKLNEIVNEVPKDQKVVMFFDQCYGGDMLSALWDKNGNIRPNTCGVAASSPGQLAFSGGGSMRNLESMVNGEKNHSNGKGRKISTKDVFIEMSKDESIISAPSLSSDIFAKRWLKENYPDYDELKLSVAKTLYHENICVDSFASSRGGFFTGKMDSNLTPVNIVKLKLLAKELRLDFIQKHSNGISLDEHSEKVKNEGLLAEENSKAYSDFLYNSYNPQMQKELMSTYPQYNDYIELKNLRNNQGQLSDEQKSQLEVHQRNVLMLKVALKDEASLKRRGYKTQYRHHHSEEILALEKELKEYNHNRIASANTHLKSMKKLSAHTTLKALDLMAKNGDIGALKTYLNIIECEEAPLVEFSGN